MAQTMRKPDEAPGGNARFEEIGSGCYAFSADGCVNTGVIIGERGVLVVDAQASPARAQEVLEQIRTVTDRPVRAVVLTHFHADSALAAQVFEPGEIIASDLTRRMLATRGGEDARVLRQRDPGLFEGAAFNAVVPAPSMTIASSMSIDLGNLEVRLMHLGRGHTMGDMVVWVPSSGVLFAGDLVQKAAVPYCGDAHLADWPRALDRITAFRPTVLVPGRGRVASGTDAVATAVETTRDYVVTLREAAVACVEQGLGLRDTYLAVADTLEGSFGNRQDFVHHLPINVARAYDEALGLDQPQVWTRERLADLQDALAGGAPVEAESAEEPSDAAVAEAPAGEASQETQGQVSDDASLVSDTDFAASLLDDDATDQAGAAAPEVGDSDPEPAAEEATEADRELEPAR